MMTELRTARVPAAGIGTARARPGRSILLLSYHYPPAPEVGGLRALKIAQSFAARGDRVHVVAGPLRTDDPIDADANPAVHRIEPSLDLRGLYRRLRHGRAPAASGDGTVESASWKPPAKTPFLKRQISSAMWLPDDHQGWILPAARVARQIAATEGLDLIYSTAPPFSGHLAGLLARRWTGARWIAEFRDPWTGNVWKPDFVRSRWSDAAERWLERRCLRRADGIVTVTDDMGETLRERLPARERDKVFVVRNGIDELAPAAPGRSGSQTVRRIAYVGTLYQNRDPRPFLRAVAALRDRGGVGEDLRVDFIGACRWYTGISVEEFVAGLGLQNVVRFTDQLPHAECMVRIRECDVLLLFAQNQPHQVPNKLYEYLGTRRPILAFADAGGETSRMLERLGGHFIIDREDPTFIEETVGAALSGRIPEGSAEAESLLDQWTAGRQLDLLHEKLAMRLQ